MTMTYRVLEESARRLFRRLAATRFADLPQWIPGALLDSSHGAGDDALAEPVEAHLVADSAAEDALTRCWRVHDLVRVFAAERAAEEDTVAEQAAPAVRLARARRDRPGTGVRRPARRARPDRAVGTAALGDACGAQRLIALGRRGMPSPGGGRRGGGRGGLARAVLGAGRRGRCPVRAAGSSRPSSSSQRWAGTTTTGR